ncbi:hypothetical protein PAPYR_8373 [Paratrimastix pyriformis]|uniref:Uncharacterized protein n=1 Tax=Paratrimastix pyriformis TaxID=342808 RepID=A0ABQ8UEW4_9EUKA|nr:hypothetical protein PAPYR_8373 [Paratrimastix pyriformis]
MTEETEPALITEFERRIDEVFGEGIEFPEPQAVIELLNYLSLHIENQEQQYALSSTDPYADRRDEFLIGQLLQHLLHFDQFFDQLLTNYTVDLTSELAVAVYRFLAACAPGLQLVVSASISTDEMILGRLCPILLDPHPTPLRVFVTAVTAYSSMADSEIGRYLFEHHPNAPGVLAARLASLILMNCTPHPPAPSPLPPVTQTQSPAGGAPAAAPARPASAPSPALAAPASGPAPAPSPVQVDIPQAFDMPSYQNLTGEALKRLEMKALVILLGALGERPECLDPLAALDPAPLLLATATGAPATCPTPPSSSGHKHSRSPATTEAPAVAPPRPPPASGGGVGFLAYLLALMEYAKNGGSVGVVVSDAAKETSAGAADMPLLGDTLRLVTALVAHVRFARVFLTSGGVEAILSLPRAPYLQPDMAIVLCGLACLPTVMEQLCRLKGLSPAPAAGAGPAASPAPNLGQHGLVTDVVRLALWLLTAGSDTARRHAAMFFCGAFSFLSFVAVFDMLNGMPLLLDMCRVREGLFSRPLAMAALSALRQYFRRHILLAADAVLRADQKLEEQQQQQLQLLAHAALDCIDYAVLHPSFQLGLLAPPSTERAVALLLDLALTGVEGAACLDQELPRPRRRARSLAFPALAAPPLPPPVPAPQPPLSIPMPSTPAPVQPGLARHLVVPPSTPVTSMIGTGAGAVTPQQAYTPGAVFSELSRGFTPAASALPAHEPPPPPPTSPMLRPDVPPSFGDAIRVASARVLLGMVRDPEVKQPSLQVDPRRNADIMAESPQDELLSLGTLYMMAGDKGNQEEAESQAEKNSVTHLTAHSARAEQ